MAAAQKVMIVGGGGREHALAWKLAGSEGVDTVLCVPGNGGTALTAKCENVQVALSDFKAIADLARTKSVDLIVIGPDNPLADGIVDYLQNEKLVVFGPTKDQAKLEWSKEHAKQVMEKLGLPTARFISCGNLEQALDFVRRQENSWARVIKADGLALGKGVFVCDDLPQVEEALRSIFGGSFGEAGNTVVMEERLEGEELSLLALSDGQTLLELACAQDHKRRYAGDQGPNTGGMGAYTPVPLYEDEVVAKRIKAEVLDPIEAAMKDGRLSFKGVLFIGLMICGGRPYILEFNARLGDPETQAVMARMESDLLPLLQAAVDGKLAGYKLNFSALKSCCVSVVAKDYPAKSSSGEKITFDGGNGAPPSGWRPADGAAIVFHAGTKLASERGELLTAGGRIFSAVGLGTTMERARRAAHEAIEKIHFDSLDFRDDIGWRALEKCASK